MQIKALGFCFCAALLGFVIPVEAQVKDTISLSQEVLAAIGMDTSAGPEHGMLASAWAINQLVKKALGYQIGSNPDSVLSIHEALKAGQGKKVTERSNALPGDLIIAEQDMHIGVCMNHGCTKIASNLASKASFGWLPEAASKDIFQGESAIYRLPVTKN